MVREVEPTGTLDKRSILELVTGPEPLIEGYRDLDAQLQSNGFDMTLKAVLRFTSGGEIGSGPATLADTEDLPFDATDGLQLSQGSYLISLNEVISLPPSIMALARPRSSLLRCGVAVHTAVWDAGYRGRSQALLSVYNPSGFRLARDARLVQMVFMYLARKVDTGYQGRYQYENL